MSRLIFSIILALIPWMSFAATSTKINALPSKPAPVVADEMMIEDSVNSWKSRKVNLGSLPVGTATQTAIDLKANAIGTLNYTSNASPSSSDILGNKYFANYGATGTITITLPAVSYEICRGIITESAQMIQMAPPSGESFDLSGTLLTADQLFGGPATVGAKAVVCRQRNAAGAWIWSVDVVRGTWAGI